MFGLLWESHKVIVGTFPGYLGLFWWSWGRHRVLIGIFKKWTIFGFSRAFGVILGGVDSMVKTGLPYWPAGKKGGLACLPDRQSATLINGVIRLG